MTIDPTRCPLCQQNNLCAAVKGTDAAQCWCQTTAISAALIANIPPQLQRKSCICQRCAEQAQQLAKEIS